MASKGMTAFIIVVALISAISILAGVGFFNELGMTVPESANDDVKSAADTLIGQEATDRSGGSVLQDFTTSAATSIATGWQIIANLSGILQLFLMLPEVMAETIQRVFQITFGLTFAFFIRGLLL